MFPSRATSERFVFLFSWRTSFWYVVSRRLRMHCHLTWPHLSIRRNPRPVGRDPGVLRLGHDPPQSTEPFTSEPDSSTSWIISQWERWEWGRRRPTPIRTGTNSVAPGPNRKKKKRHRTPLDSSILPSRNCIISILESVSFFWNASSKRNEVPTNGRVGEFSFYFSHPKKRLNIRRLCKIEIKTWKKREYPRSRRRRWFLRADLLVGVVRALGGETLRPQNQRTRFQLINRSIENCK